MKLNKIIGNIITITILLFAFNGNEIASYAMLFMGWLSITIYSILNVSALSTNKNIQVMLAKVKEEARKMPLLEKLYSLVLALVYVIFFLKSGWIITATVFIVSFLLAILNTLRK